MWEKERVGCFERTILKHVYYQQWNRSPTQVGCMRQVLGAGALGRPRRIGWRGRLEGGLGWGIHVNPWLIHVHVWQKPLQYCKAVSLQLIKINGKKKFFLKIKNKSLLLTFIKFYMQIYFLYLESIYMCVYIYTSSIVFLYLERIYMYISFFF